MTKHALKAEIALIKNLLLHRQFSLNCSKLIFFESTLLISPKKRLIAFLQSFLYDNVR